MSDKERMDMIVKMTDAVQILAGLVLRGLEECKNRDKTVKHLLNVIRIQAEMLEIQEEE